MTCTVQCRWDGSHRIPCNNRRAQHSAQPACMLSEGDTLSSVQLEKGGSRVSLITLCSEVCSSQRQGEHTFAAAAPAAPWCGEHKSYPAHQHVHCAWATSHIKATPKNPVCDAVQTLCPCHSQYKPAASTSISRHECCKLHDCLLVTSCAMWSTS